jgi:hypothetical protein
MSGRKLGKAGLASAQEALVSRDFTEEDYEKAMGFNVNDCTVIAREVAFDGFDPAITFNIVMQKIDGNPALKACLLTILTFSQTRGFGAGKTWDTIISMTSTGGGLRIQGAVEAFDIKLGRPMSKTTVTVPRLVSAFPMLVYRIRVKLIESGTISDDVMIQTDLPLSLQFTGSPAVVDGDAWFRMKDDYLDFSRQLSRKWGDEQDDETIFKFGQLAHGTKTVPASKRLHESDFPDFFHE